MSDLRDLQDRIDTLMEKFQEIEQYNIIIEENRIKYPERNKAKYKETSLLLINTRKKMEEGLEAGEGYEIKFKKELLEIEIPTLGRECAAMTKTLEEAKFADPNSDVDYTCREIEKIGLKVAQIKERGKELNRF